jgi:hypothetical protein
MVGRAIPAAALRPARAGVLSLEPVNLAAPAALATLTKGADGAIVDDAVAVVVQPIAGFGARLTVLNTGRDVVDTLPRAGAADAMQASGARRPGLATGRRNGNARPGDADLVRAARGPVRFGSAGAVPAPLAGSAPAAPLEFSLGVCLVSSYESNEAAEGGAHSGATGRSRGS